MAGVPLAFIVLRRSPHPYLDEHGMLLGEDDVALLALRIPG
jgi:hypothetical protein